MLQPPSNEGRINRARRILSLIRWRRSGDPSKPRSEIGTAVAGILLGLTCALFPWYVFYNQDQFGIRAMKFSGENMVATAPGGMTAPPARVGMPMTVEEAPQMPLDPFATGTLPLGIRGDRDEPSAAELANQPFPEDALPFRMVHATLGRAMIEDDGGLFVVQPGSRLPDSSRVRTIEQRDGAWVLVTSRDRVLPLQP